MRAMNFKILFYFLMSTSTLVVAQETSITDMIPVISQIKSMFQLITGDAQGAHKTQQNFINEGLITSQASSLYHLAKGDTNKAIDIQKKFFTNMEPVVNGIPIIGHIKGITHLINGDTEEGWNAIKSATSTTGSLAGGLVAGPAGAVGGHVLTDALITGVDSTISEDWKPHGIVDYASNIHRTSSGEHFDMLAGLGLDAYTGNLAKTQKTKYNLQAPTDNIALQSTYTKKIMDVNEGKHTNIGQSNSQQALAKGYQQSKYTENFQGGDRNLQNPEGNVDSGQNLNILYETNMLKSDSINTELQLKFERFIIRDEVLGHMKMNYAHYQDITIPNNIDNYRLTSFLDTLDINSLVEKLKYLDSETKSLITKDDFKTINTMTYDSINCIQCSLSAILNIDLNVLQKSFIDNSIVKENVGVNAFQLLDKMKNHGLLSYSATKTFSNIYEHNLYLIEHASDLNGHDILLCTIDKTNFRTGHTKVFKFKSIDHFPKKLILDFQIPGLLSSDLPNPYRFRQTIDMSKIDGFFMITIKKNIDNINEFNSQIKN